NEQPSRILEEVYESAKGLHKIGLIDKKRMREYEVLYCANQVPQYTGDNVKALRDRLNVSQAALAMMINTSAATVRSWEAGTQKPGGPSCKLLNILERKGIEALL
ncbi:helix-turn-helix domain-containing protein, partial [Desulfovibrio sp. OttesenSCG-928-M16]|nr:helix-turn-helix domain-containing protein [Desulfovibrio sp. OttesenSCG-928-M16]